MRKQRPRGSTTRQSVIEAALAVVDEDGLEGLTIRRVAQRVGAPPMSLYTHFSNKGELLDLMYVELAERMYRDQGYQSWQTELLALCHRIRALLLEHPNWAPLLSRSATPLRIPLRDRVLAMMAEGGASSEHALRALSSAILLSMGHALVELTLRTPDGESALEKRFGKIKEWVDSTQGEDHAATREAFTRVAHFRLDEMFEFTAHALIEGLDVDGKRRQKT